jgi:hypothetical protein
MSRQLDVKALVAAYNSGKSLNQLSRQFQASYGGVYKALTNSGMKLRARGGANNQTAALGKSSNAYDWGNGRAEVLAKLWAEGVSGHEIARRFGCCHDTVTRKAANMGLPVRQPPPTKSPPMTDALKAEAAAMRNAGHSWIYIAAKMGRDRSLMARTVQRFMREQRVTQPKPVGLGNTGRIAELAERFPHTGFALRAGHPITCEAIGIKPWAPGESGL